MNYLFFIIVIAVVVAVILIAAFTNFKLDNEHYDRLKWLVIRWDCLVVFVGVIVKAFEVPYGLETVTVVAGIGAMLGGLLGVSSANYKFTSIQDTFNSEDFVDMLNFEYGEVYQDEEETDSAEEQ